MILEQELGIVAMEPMGEYDNTIKYEKLNIVTYKGSSYCALGDTLGNDPTNDEYWQLIAKKGDKGDTYELTDEDKENIKNDITENANSDFNKNVESKTNTFNDNVTEKTSSFNTNVENKTKEFNDNSTTKLEEFNTNSTNKLEEYNTNANAKLNEYNANADGVMTIAVDTRNELERVKNDILETGEASGDYLHLEDSTMAELQELEVNSNEKQVTTNGYNLWNFNVDQDTKVKVNDDGTITINGEGGFTLYIEPITLETGKTYYETFELVSGSITGSETVFLSSSPNVWMINKIPVSYTMTEDKERTGIWIDAAATFNNATVKLWITEGEKKDWETYTGLKASPSPDYPQEIPMITTDSVLKSIGKNFLNNDMAVSKIENGIEFTKNEDGSITLNGTATSTMGYNIGHTELPKGTYVLSSGNKVPNGIWLTLRNDEVDKTTFTNNNVATFTLNTKSINATVYLWINKNITINNLTIYPMISSEDGEFEPYQETILNLPIPEGEFVGYINDNAKDTFRVGYNEEDGNYHLYLDKMLSKIVLDGDESYVYESNNKRFYTYLSFNYSITNRSLFLCNLYVNGDSLKEGAFGTHSSGNVLYFHIPSEEIITVDSFKTWLSTNNVEVVYELSEPYTLDLGIVDMPLSYDGVTNIFVDTDFLMNINTKYYRNFTETIRNLQINNDTLKNELINIESRLTALENAQVSIVNESEVVE